MTTPRISGQLRQALQSVPGPLPVAAIVNATAAIVIKLDRATIRGFRGPILIGYRAELGLYEPGAIVRLVVDFHDQPPDAPFRVDTFLDPDKAEDLRLLRLLTRQATLDIHLLDLRLDYQFSKRIRHRDISRRELADMLAAALVHNAALPAVDFAAAKARMMEDRPL